jgi:hypothetical protein
VKIKRIFGGTVAALLMCVSSLSAACDLSCGFSLFRSDCHSPQMAASESSPPDMTMAGMTMPESAGDSPANQQVVSSAPQRMPAHAVLVEMGACTRQSCDRAQVLASRSNHSMATQFGIISTVAGFSDLDRPQIVFHNARDDISPLNPVVHRPLDVSLRI